MNKENWIEEVVQASRHIQPLEPNPFLATRVEAVLRKGADTDRLPLRWVWLSAAVMAVLLVLNVLAWRRPQPHRQPGIQSVMQEYGWGNNGVYSANF